MLPTPPGHRSLCVEPKAGPPVLFQFHLPFPLTEGKANGIETELADLLSDYTQRPVTYAGGVGSMEDLKLLKKHGKDRLDVTVGSALDLFGGTIPFETLKNLDDLHI